MHKPVFMTLFLCAVGEDNSVTISVTNSHVHQEMLEKTAIACLQDVVNSQR